MFYAHSADDPAHWEPLELHLGMVAERAAGPRAASEIAGRASATQRGLNLDCEFETHCAEARFLAFNLQRRR